MLITTVVILLLSQSHSLSVARQSLSTRSTASLRTYPSTTSMASADKDNSDSGTVTNHRNDRVNKKNEDDGSRWRIWSVIDELETNGLSSNCNAHSCIQNDECVNSRDDDMTNQVVQILRHWGESWAGQTGWHSLLNKKSL
mmetsp:Transcript_1805/g.3265  ORF Transcript_1805/g.3265 Transcript_1805/m.3265 type:complete len:141 (-) Transcript_1805:366-788(-)